MKLASLLFTGPGGREPADPDTVIVDDMPSARVADAFTPDTVVDGTLMAAPSAYAGGRGESPKAARRAPERARGERPERARAQGFATRIPLIGGMPFRKQLQVLLPTLIVSLLIAFMFLWLDSRQANSDGSSSPAGAPGSAGRSAGVITSPEDRMSRRSTRFRSSRTLPGHEWRRRMSRVSGP